MGFTHEDTGLDQYNLSGIIIETCLKIRYPLLINSLAYTILF